MRAYIKKFKDKFTVWTFASQSIESNPRAIANLPHVDIDKICWAKAASDKDSQGFQFVTSACYGKLEDNDPDVEADCVLLTEPSSAIIFRVGDCPVLIIYEQTTRTMVVIHCGRPALTPILYKRPYERKNVVTLACEKLLRGISNPIVHAHITSCICPEHFAHESPEGQELVKPFEEFGEKVFTDRAAGKLDLKEVIKGQLRSLIQGELTITEDDYCTYETPWLASHRRHPTEKLRSPVVVVLH